MARTDYRNIGPLTRTGARFWALVAGLIAVIGWASYAESLQLPSGLGLGVTGMNNSAYWGLYIVNFVFLIGLSAGGVIIASLAHAFGMEKYRPISRMAELLAVITLILAMIFITLDLGRPDRLQNLFLYSQLGSPLIWDVTIILVYLSIALVYGFFGFRRDIVRLIERLPKRSGFYKLMALGYTNISERALKRDHKILKIFAAIALPAAVGLHSITAWILGVIKAQPGWYTAIIAPLFVLSAIVSGMALVLFVVVVARRLLKYDIKDEIIKDLGKFLAFLIPIDFYFTLAEIVVVGFGGPVAETRVWNSIIFGSFAPAFWTEMIVGLAIPLVILANPRTRTVTGVGIASFLVVAGVFAKRINIVVPPLLVKLLPYPLGFYLPTWVEYSLMIGTWAIGVLILLIFVKLFPVAELEPVHAEGT